MKRKTLKTYLSIPVFLGMLALTGQVSADETVVPPSDAADNTSLATTPATLPETGVTTPVAEKPVASSQPTSVETAGEETAPTGSDSTETALTTESTTSSSVAPAQPTENQPGDEATDSETTSSPEQPAVATATPHASLQVIDYKEDKTDFTVKVMGSEETKAISYVRVAVWSDSKGQDDIKWYEPVVRNNQASARVDIANHSNTSDDYHVHVYTTYKDNTTVGTNLGTYRIEKPSPQAVVNLAERGSYTFTERTPIKREPKISSPDRAYYEVGEKVNYDSKLEVDNYLWISYINYSGGRSYVPIAKLTLAQPTTPTDPAKAEVVDYKEDKTSFTVRVTGSAETKPVSYVRVAVWSDNKGQDDIKWYEPAVQNNQASVKVDIANHSNTSDNYHVHVYTTYKDNTTTGINLGTYKIVKPGEASTTVKPAKVEVVDYKEDKTNFTVQVTGSAETKPVSYVRVAVWSDNKGQDDIKWYEPVVQNNQASVKVDIANHSNTSDDYHVHVYTTYKDNTTVGTNLGTYRIEKSNPQALDSLAESGSYTFTERVPIKREPKISSPDRAYYEAGEKVNYDSKLKADNYLWISYINYSGSRSYIPISKIDSVQSATLATPAGPAKVEVVDYKEDKTDFTVQVTGSAETKTISHVRVAVWSDAKGQDDIKWYQPSIVANQANAKIDIANHSNTSDDYHVHVYTTYKDNTTVGTNLGTYKIVKPSQATFANDSVSAEVGVVNYKEDKTNFTVQVDGTNSNRKVTHVRVAVWSDGKGQDDLKWYEPKVVDNHASALVDISNHSNTSDNYHVHVYTTYNDNKTVGTNLGTYKIVKPIQTSSASDTAKITVIDYKENKTDFTVHVDGTDSIRKVAQVRVAVWSDGKGQDDLKWYEPKVVDNQAKVKVHISNHSNTSDNYHVHVYTTYEDKTTIGSNLGTYKITRPQGARANVEIVDHEEGKKDFVVQVTGTPGGSKIQQVRVAVWSNDKGQDDLKWYEPKIVNNQASVKVNRENHANSLGDYTVHVYTTYADKVTVGTDLGSIKLSAASGDYKEKAQQFAGKLFNVIGDYVAYDSMLSPLVSAIKHIEDQGYQVGFKLSDVRTNKGIEYNANRRFYSASTIKAPFVVSLAEQYPEKIAEHRPVLEAIAKQSSNSGYAQLQERYGHGVIHHWADQSGINRDRISRRYPDLTPEELHALWESNYEYIQEGAHGKQIGAMFETPNLSPIKSVLGQSYKTQSKAGWIGDWEYRAANDAGIVYTPKGDYIVSIMSNSYGNLGLLNPLVKALNQLHQKL